MLWGSRTSPTVGILHAQRNRTSVMRLEHGGVRDEAMQSQWALHDPST